MKNTPRDGQPQSRLSRRTVFAGATTVGALAAAATVLPRGAAPEATAAAEPKPAPERGGGYALSDHIKHYYQTARL
jgi:hypothetical protein